MPLAAAATVAPLGGEILVNSATHGNQKWPVITALGGGGFVVAWSDYSLGHGGAIGDTSGWAVKAQVFAADGSQVGSEILVNTAAYLDQYFPVVAALNNGAFVIVWTDNSEGLGGASGDSSQYAVKAQVFDATGAKAGSEILVNTATRYSQFNTEVAPLAGGGFVVSWDDRSSGVGGATPPSRRRSSGLTAASSEMKSSSTRRS